MTLIHGDTITSHTKALAPPLLALGKTPAKSSMKALLHACPTSLPLPLLSQGHAADHAAEFKGALQTFLGKHTLKS